MEANQKKDFYSLYVQYNILKSFCNNPAIDFVRIFMPPKHFSHSKAARSDRNGSETNITVLFKQHP
jgi:hypothetical protein